MQRHISALLQKYGHCDVDFEANSATVGASWSRGRSAVATEQMLAQQHVWRTSQLAALSAANQTGYISCTSSILKKDKLKNLSMYFHFEMTQGCFGAETNIFARGLLLKTLLPLPDFETHAESVKLHSQPIYVWSWKVSSYFTFYFTCSYIHLTIQANKCTSG